MLLAACLGFALQNTGALDAEFASFRFQTWPWISQFGMALFFALIGFELRNEFATGLFRNPRTIIVPAIAALVGVIVPAATYLAIAASSGATAEVISAWPMVTATDVSFALMAFSLLAKGLPKTLRAFLLSFAVIDDIFATLALAIGFMRLDALTPLLSTAAAMVLAFSLRPKQVKKVITFLSPLVAFAVLPVFAFFAMQVNFNPNAIFAGSASILVLLIASRSISKWLGVYLGAILGNRMLKKQERLEISNIEFMRISSLAGIGFTVSLLAADLAFGAESPFFAAAASLTVLASLVAAGLAAIALKARRASI
ncbi:MAG: hypothetical protein RL196_1002 [Actinomycetota bacterium]|jgi:NhaA family Na+:H+ antiporter